LENIEEDGKYHNELNQFKYDESRTEELVCLGLKVIRFTNNQVLFDIEKTLKGIEKVIIQRLNKLIKNNLFRNIFSYLNLSFYNFF
jgi:very-short-patch-repair endonuclease